METKLFNKNYLLIVFGNAVSAIGDVLYSVSIGYWVYETTGSTALMGLTSSISFFVVMFISPLAGSIIDKIDRKLVIVLMDVLRGLIMLGVSYLAFSQKLNVAMIIVTAFLCAMASVFFSPAISTALIDIIPHDDMVRGQSIQGTVTSLINLAGKAFSGALIVIFGVPLIILINGISYLLSAFSEMFINLSKTPRQNQKIDLKGLLRDLKEAAKSVYQNKYLRIFAFAAIVANFFGSGSGAMLLPLMLEKGFGVDYYGYITSIETLASLVIVMVLSVKKFKPKTRYYLMSMGFIGSSLVYILGYVSSHFLLMAISFFLGALLSGLGNALFNAALMLSLPQENRGAIIGFVQSASVGGQALSSVFYGIVCDIYPIVNVFVISSILMLIPLLMMCLNKNTYEFVLNH